MHLKLSFAKIAAIMYRGDELIPAWASNCIHHQVLKDITYPFPNLNGDAIEVWEWISNFTLLFSGHVITYPSTRELSHSLHLSIQKVDWCYFI